MEQHQHFVEHLRYTIYCTNTGGLIHNVRLKSVDEQKKLKCAYLSSGKERLAQLNITKSKTDMIKL